MFHAWSRGIVCLRHIVCAGYNLNLRVYDVLLVDALNATSVTGSPNVSASMLACQCPFKLIAPSYVTKCVLSHASGLECEPSTYTPGVPSAVIPLLRLRSRLTLLIMSTPDPMTLIVMTHWQIGLMIEWPCRSRHCVPRTSH